MTARLLVLEDGAVVAREPRELSELRERLCWLDVAGPGSADFALVAEELGLHPLAIEDARQRHQRPKVDEYEGHYFIVMYAVESPEGEDLREISMFVMRNVVVTVHEGEVGALREVEGRWREGRLNTTGMLLHALLDAMVDALFPVVDALGDRIDALEEAILSGGRSVDLQTALRSLFETKRRLLRLRQRVASERDVLDIVARGDLKLFTPEEMPYFQDVYDHVIRVTDEIDIFRDIASNVIDAHLAAASNRLNEVMKVLTAVATILLVITVVTGFFGMNFTLLPFDSAAVFGAAVAFMVLSTVGLVAYFRRMEWL